jgi:hypothetical protein
LLTYWVLPAEQIVVLLDEVIGDGQAPPAGQPACWLLRIHG